MTPGPDRSAGKCRDGSSIACGPVVAGRAHAAEPHIDTAPRPFGALYAPGFTSPAQSTATYVTGSVPVTASARPSFTSRRRWASASETAMFLEP